MKKVFYSLASVAVALSLGMLSLPAAAQESPANMHGINPDDPHTAVIAALVAVGLTGVPNNEDQSCIDCGQTITDLTGHDPDQGASEDRASVRVTGEYDKDKDVRVIELVAKLKVAIVFSGALIAPDGAAESDLVAQQDNIDNDVDHTGGEVQDDGNIDLDADISESVTFNNGITQLNQDVGNYVNQGNVLSVAVSTATTVFADSNASVTQRVDDSDVDTNGTFEEANPEKDADITDSVNDNTGITMVNQNAGNTTNQINAVSLAIAQGGIVALAEADLGQFNSDNTVDDFSTFKFTDLTNSANRNTGITTINQNTGHMNNQGTVISFSGVTNGLPGGGS